MKTICGLETKTMQLLVATGYLPSEKASDTIV